MKLKLIYLKHSDSGINFAATFASWHDSGPIAHCYIIRMFVPKKIINFIIIY